MCFTRRKIREKKERLKKQKYILNRYINLNLQWMKQIACSSCFKDLLSQIKINCAGCDKFFHCKVAGTCYGENCKEETRAGRLHRLSWCVNCVPKIPENKEKSIELNLVFVKNVILRIIYSKIPHTLLSCNQVHYIVSLAKDIIPIYV